MSRPRLIVTTDITSVQAGYKEPDDCQSLVRLLSMSDQFQIEGMIASSRLGHGQDACPQHIEHVVNAYAQVERQLRKHSPTFPEAGHLRSVIKGGQPIAKPDLPVEASIGDGDDTAASDWIISRLKDPSREPLWVIAWGGTADLAQALWRIRESLPAAEQKKLRAKLRIYSIGDQDSTGPWIRANFPELFYLIPTRVYRGVYRWGDTRLCSSEWVQENIIKAGGALGAAYPDYRGGDIFGATLGPVHGMKEGDTPSFLYLFENGLNRPDRPDLGGWGGRFVPVPGTAAQWTDARDELPGVTGEIPRKAATVFRWREAFQREFAARMQWCVREPGQASRPPIVKVNGPAARRVKLGSGEMLDLGGSSDAGGGPVSVRWFSYPAGGEIEFESPTSCKTRVIVRSAEEGSSQHAVAELTGPGELGMIRYARIELKVI